MEADIFHLANILRPTSPDIFSGKGKLCLSVNYLNKLNAAIDAHIDEDVSSFQIVQTSNTKTNLMRDIQFLLDLIGRTGSLKLTPDEVVENNLIDLTKFKNIKSLEIIKLDINIVTGLQKLRSQIQELTCCKCLKCIEDVLEKCGGDKSQPYSWNELRILNLSHNEIVEMDNSFECTLSLHTVDLSHNHLTKANFINLLPNLKHLNLSYNKLDAAPMFKGQIRNRLQILVLNNNFLEDLNGLTSLSNLSQLDLGHNCLLDHKCLLSISHFVSLQWLNLQGNPISFHPHHRHMTCNYLNKNASTVKFLLNGINLNKNERSLTGSLYPISQTIQTSSSTNSLESSVSSVVDKPRKIRNVTIVDVEETELVKEVEPVSNPSTPSQHLEIKRQVEQLRSEYGESWLYRHSGLMVQDVLGFDKTLIMSSTPLESTIDGMCMAKPSTLDTTHSSEFKSVENLSTDEVSTKDDIFCTAEGTAIGNGKSDDEFSDASDGEDVFSGGEDCMFLATNSSDNNQVFVVVTDSHISERDVTTSKEKARWHINTVIACEKCEEENVIKLEFDTLRRDRKQRIYELSPGERDVFYTSIKEKIDKVSKTDDNQIYQCMKCSEVFQRSKNALLNQPAVVCPKCSSNMVVESV